MSDEKNTRKRNNAEPECDPKVAAAFVRIERIANELGDKRDKLVTANIDALRLIRKAMNSTKDQRAKEMYIAMEEGVDGALKALLDMEDTDTVDIENETVDWTKEAKEMYEEVRDDIETEAVEAKQKEQEKTSTGEKQKEEAKESPADKKEEKKKGMSGYLKFGLGVIAVAAAAVVAVVVLDKMNDDDDYIDV